MSLKVTEGRCIEEAKRVLLVMLFQCLDSAGRNDVDEVGVGDDGRDDDSGRREDSLLRLNNGWEGYGVAGGGLVWLDVP